MKRHTLLFTAGFYVMILLGCSEMATAPARRLQPSASVRSLSPVPCVFNTKGTTETLQNDCVVDATVYVPDGWTLNGNGHSITGVDPAGGHFLGAVVKNAGSSATVKNLTVTVDNLANICDPSSPVDTRLRGILFDGASGSITNNVIHDVNQAESGCQEGNSIEVRNFGSSLTTISVEVANNTITNFMKTGIVVNGNAVGNVHNNTVGASADQGWLAANSIQFGYGAQGTIKSNQVAGNQWCNSADDATAILLYEADPSDGVTPLTVSVNVTQNVFTGNANIGIYAFGNGMTVNNNKVYDDNTIADCGDDIGIYNDVSGDDGDNTFTNNKVGGFDLDYSNVVTGNNKSNPNK